MPDQDVVKLVLSDVHNIRCPHCKTYSLERDKKTKEIKCSSCGYRLIVKNELGYEGSK